MGKMWSTYLNAKKIFCIIIYFMCYTVNEVELQVSNLRVRLDNGILEGRQARTVGKNKTYYAFEGIPFAKPPIGNLRFAAPVPADNWEGVLDATKPRSTCIELYEPSGSEDCLYINVFTPSLNATGLPVMVWLHGGAFIFIYPKYTLAGSDFFIDEDVVFITVHYRLGVFGFLSTEDEVIPGNFGLKDQVLAIDWVNRNVRAFGGDPNKVTLIGQSAGGVSASYLAMSPLIKGKIHRVIQQTGTALGSYALSRFARAGAYVLGSHFNVSTTDSKILLEELRKKDAEDLRRNSLTTEQPITFGTSTFNGLLFTPVTEPESLESAFITKKSYEKLKKGDFNRIPHLLGFNSVEGMYLLDVYPRFWSYYSNYDTFVTRFIPFDMNTRSIRAGELIKEHYTGGAPFTSNITNMVHFGSDDQYVRPVHKEAVLLSKYVPTYLYHFSYEGELGNPMRRMRGVGHGEELEYLFRNPDRGEVSEKDMLTRFRLVKMWTNFVKYGDPTPIRDDLLQNTKWAAINSASQNVDYLDIGENLVSAQNPHKDDIDFWDHLYQCYGNPPYDTY